jgi:hydroxyethylthiazole kinase-like uncharacterized protein yjeF
MQTLDALQFAHALTRKETAHKGDCGKVLLVGGATSMAGALTLSARASLHSGAGWTVLMMFDSACAHLISDQPELMVHDACTTTPEQALSSITPDVIAIGPGLGQGAHAKAWLGTCLNWHGPLIIDADALNLLASHADLLEDLRGRTEDTTLTPHPGEAARLLSRSVQAVQLDRQQAILDLVDLAHCSVVLKGHHTLLLEPLGEIHKCAQGNPGMAVGGMGDVLTGCIAALAAQGVKHSLSLWQATCLGVQVHAMAADSMLQDGTGPIGMTPSELILYIRKILNQSLALMPAE